MEPGNGSRSGGIATLNRRHRQRYDPAREKDGTILFSDHAKNLALLEDNAYVCGKDLGGGIAPRNNNKQIAPAMF